MCQDSSGHGANLGRGTAWGPSGTRYRQSVLVFGRCSPSRWHQHPAASVAGRTWQGLSRASAQPGAWQDGEAATSVAGRGCFIGESAGGCGEPQGGGPGEEAEAEGSGLGWTVRGWGLGLQDSCQAAASLWPGWQEAGVPAKGADAVSRMGTSAMPQVLWDPQGWWVPD